MELKHSFPRVGARKGDIYAFLEPADGDVERRERLILTSFLPPLDSVVQSPWNIRGSKDKYTSVIVTNAVHLNQKLSLDTSRPFRLALITSSSERIYFVDEDDSRFVFSCHLE